MIIAKVTGGLGNQMFIYAAAKALAEVNVTNVKLDLTEYNKKGLRYFQLDLFNLNYEIATYEEIKYFTQRNLLQKLFQFLLPIHKKKFVKEKSFAFNKSFFKYKSPVYIQGYWQSEKYFNNISKTIFDSYQLESNKFINLNSITSKIENENSVAIHIRRGDYKNVESKEYHGILEMDFYNEAISYISKKVNNASFYIFSDDTEWVKENVKYKEVTIVSVFYTKTAIEDFYLLSKCKHNIIANSSFSWWAAWLNLNPNKIVIAPKKWFGPKGPNNFQDIYPDGWIKL